MKKKGTGILLFVIAVIITLLVVKIKLDNKPVKLKEESWGVVTDAAGLYEKSDMETSIGVLRKGNTVQLVSEKDGVYEVTRGDIRGWVDASVIEKTEYPTYNDVLTYDKNLAGDIVVITPDPTEEPTLPPEAAPAPVLARPIEWVNMRSGPSIDYEVLMVVQENQTVEILDDSQSWYRVEVDGVEGWIFNSYLEIID